ncbi:AraC family transcriptional regulator [Nocardioides marinquilinus]|uniref:AraC family transcriptional regulator n=1 Tax=Nocardioides marinquilinus TaxID=1210400 RepID=A0ABP9PU14_9ACTN
MLDRWNRAIAEIEERLAETGEPVDVAALARTALTSEHHFRRVFSALAGMPLSDYVRRRRLTLATAEVVAGAGVLDVAVRHGYGSAEAFTRAFKAWHAMTPSEARRPGAVLQTQPRLTFHLRIEGADPMRHRIERLDGFTLVGRHARLPLRYEGENTALVDFHRSLPAGLDDRLRELADVPALPGLLSASSGFEEGRGDGSDFDHHHAVATTRSPAELPDDLDTLRVEPSTWVVFEADGPTADGVLLGRVQQLWAEAFSQWFPANPYQVVPGPEVLRLTYADDGASGRGELWLPVEHVAG